MDDMQKRFEVLVEHTEVARVVVSAVSMSVAQEIALECVRRGNVESSKCIGQRCVGGYELS